MARERRYQLADVTAESREGWQAFSRRHNVNPTVLAEVLGHWFAANVDVPRSRLSVPLRDLLDEAEALAAARRERLD